jgi:ribose 5-phosphate isomerase A
MADGAPIDRDVMKRAAAERAAALVEDGMLVGLGSGSTARLLVDALAARVQGGLRFTGVPTSEATAAQARAAGIPLSTIDEHPRLDMVIDGADEVDPDLNLIKGLGGALLREKIVASGTSHLTIIVDESKIVDRLGAQAALPVEVVKFGWTQTAARIQGLGARCELRQDQNGPFITDGGNYILHCRFDTALHLAAMAAPIKALTGVVEHGLFIGMAVRVLVGTKEGVTTLTANRNAPAPAASE